MNRDRFTKEQIAEALHQTKGLIGMSARRLGVTTQTIHNYFKKYPELKEIRNEARCTLIDSAELALESAVLDKQGWAVCFVLKTLGRDRGYAERITIDIQKLDADIDRELARLAAGGEGSLVGEAESEAVN